MKLKIVLDLADLVKRVAGTDQEFTPAQVELLARFAATHHNGFSRRAWDAYLAGRVCYNLAGKVRPVSQSALGVPGPGLESKTNR